EAELMRLLEEDRGVLTDQDQVDALGLRLADLGDVAREVLRPDRWILLADDFLLRGLDLRRERRDAVAAPGVVPAERGQALPRPFRQVEADRAGAHRPARVDGAEVPVDGLR